MATYQSPASSSEAVVRVPACARTVIYYALLWITLLWQWWCCLDEQNFEELL